MGAVGPAVPHRAGRAAGCGICQYQGDHRACETKASTSGGTSDGRFIATLGTQVVELGPVNATIHQVNERILASDLDVLTEIYYQTLIKLLA